MRPVINYTHNLIARVIAYFLSIIWKFIVKIIKVDNIKKENVFILDSADDFVTHDILEFAKINRGKKYLQLSWNEFGQTISSQLKNQI